MKTLIQTLKENGFELTDTFRGKTTYRHPDFQSRCIIKGDGSRLTVNSLNLTPRSTLTITIYSGSYSIGHLEVHGDCNLTLQQPLELGHLSLHSSNVDNLSLHGPWTRPHLYLHKSSVSDITMHLPEDYTLSLDRCKLHNLIINPHHGNHAQNPVASSMSLTSCAIYGWKEDTDIILTSSLKDVEMNIIRWLPDNSELILHADDVTGTVFNILHRLTPYRLMCSDETPYLMLGCWLGTLEQARALFEGQANKWPGYRNYRIDHGLPKDSRLISNTEHRQQLEHIEHTRKCHLAILDMLETYIKP